MVVQEISTLSQDLHRLFSLQSQHYLIAGKSSASERLTMLKSLEKALLAWRPKIHHALRDDFAKPSQEVDLVDIYYVLREIRHTRQHLRSWMQSKNVSTPLAFFGARSSIEYEAKGMSLIISPWNYPVNLSLGPLTSAIAAGCTAILKPSEATPHTSALLKQMLLDVFDEKHVAVAEGDASVSQHLLTMPFHHIFFTGSVRVGKIVMEAASKHLTSVTLELGGKCPALIDASADLETTARRIVHTKFVNAGQTCIAPDYVLVHRSVHDQLIQFMTETVRQFYPGQDVMQRDYCSMVHQPHFDRMLAMLEDAIDHGARIVTGGNADRNTRKISPTILSHVSADAKVMQEEIFGPLLPVIPFDKTAEAIGIVNKMERPLGLYVFGKGKVVDEILSNTRAGGTCINHCALNYYNPGLPFGGVNHSGFGKSHGFAGFEAFSNARGTYRQVLPFTPLDWLHAPYTKAKQRLIDFTLRWL